MQSQPNHKFESIVEVLGEPYTQGIRMSPRCDSASESHCAELSDVM